MGREQLAAEGGIPPGDAGADCAADQRGEQAGQAVRRDLGEPAQHPLQLPAGSIEVHGRGLHGMGRSVWAAVSREHAQEQAGDCRQVGEPAAAANAVVHGLGRPRVYLYQVLAHDRPAAGQRSRGRSVPPAEPLDLRANRHAKQPRGPGKRSRTCWAAFTA